MRLGLREFLSPVLETGTANIPVSQAMLKELT